MATTKTNTIRQAYYVGEDDQHLGEGQYLILRERWVFHEDNLCHVRQILAEELPGTDREEERLSEWCPP